MPRVASIAFFCLLTGCSIATLPAAPDRAFDIDASFDDTWAALVAHISGEAWPIGTLEKDSGLLTVNDTTLSYSPEAFTCAKAGIETVLETRIRMSFVVRSIDDSTSNLTINLVSQARVENAVGVALTGGGDSRWVPCESHGGLEQNIIDGITRNLDS